MSIINMEEKQTFKSTVDVRINDTTQRNRSLQQLKHSLLPVYKPGDSALIKKYECQTYSCSACGDTFIAQSSISFHLQRRSILVRLKCDSCPTVQTFYNRCSVLIHIQAHAEKGEPSDLYKAVVLPLPRIIMEDMQTDLVSNENRESHLKDVDMPDHLRILEVSLSEGEMKMDTQSKIKSIQIEGRKFRCSECDVDFSSFEERRDHFTNKDKLPTIISCCPNCGILCPSECSAKAHKRLHLQISPYVCPECGDNPNRYWDHFQRHLMYQCFHYARSFGYKCALCNELFLSLELLKQHTIANHIEILYKCQMCPMAFTSFTSFQIHKRKSHTTGASITNNMTDAVQMYKCVTCDVVYLDKEECDSHCDDHLKENICKYAYRCGECSKIVESKSKLRDHIESEHSEIYQKNTSALHSGQETISLSKSKKDFRLNACRIECLLCHGSFTSRQGLSVHVTKSHSNHKYPCGVCGKPAINRIAMMSHGKEHLRDNVPMCLLCHNKQMSPSETLDHHLLYHVESLTYQTVCPICEMSLSTFADTLQHLQTEHYLKPNISEKKNQATISLASKSEKEKTFNSERIPRSLAPTDSLLGSAILSRDGAQFNLHGNSLSSRLQTGENTCVKCDFKNSDRSEFKKHLLTHKNKKSSHQCQECGLCFVVEPSLKKHLKIAHEIVQVEQYLREEGSNYSPENETIQEINKGNDLECTVCLEVFTSEAQLKTHMRSHGLAFIQAKKYSGI